MSYCWNKSGYTVDMLNIIITTCTYVVSNTILPIPRCPTWSLAGDPSLSCRAHPATTLVLKASSGSPQRFQEGAHLLWGHRFWKVQFWKKKKNGQSGEWFLKKTEAVSWTYLRVVACSNCFIFLEISSKTEVGTIDNMAFIVSHVPFRSNALNLQSTSFQTLRFA